MYVSITENYNIISQSGQRLLFYRYVVSMETKCKINLSWLRQKQKTKAITNGVSVGITVSGFAERGYILD
jgi:hypothetical protein